MHFTLLPVAYGTGMALVDVGVFALLKKISLDTSLSKWLFMAVFFYAMQPIIFLQALQFESMSVMNLIWNVVSTVLVTIMGLIVFKEKIGFYKKIGIFLSFLSILLLSLED